MPEATTRRLAACALDATPAQLTLRVRSTQLPAPWPLCALPARRMHSHSERTLAALPWAAYRVRLQRRVRTWFGRHRHGRRRLFPDRLPTIAAPWARRTLRLAQRLVALGVARGGTAGVRRRYPWALGRSRHPLRRLLRRQLAPSFPPPTGLGVAACALRTRQTYGPVLIALERRHPVALLPERPADPFALWLREPPGGKGIARDRSPASAAGARPGAPAAPQVADRFPLLQQLREALDQGCRPHGQGLDAVHALGPPPSVPRPEGALAVPVPPQDLPLPAPQRAAQRQAHRPALHTQVWAWHRQGWTAPAIAQQVGLRLRTVQRELRTAPCAGRRRRSDRGERGRTP